jgi:hypothetical protein
MRNPLKVIISALQTWTNKRIKSNAPDWNQNDSNGEGYIKNRPFFTDTSSKITVIMPKTTLNYGSFSDITTPLIVGNTYTVTFDGTDYKCECKEYDGYRILGNNAIYEYDNGVVTDTGEPFAAEVEGNYKSLYWYFRNGDTETHTVSISTLAETIQKIDKKYLPDFAPVATSGSYNDLIDTPEVPWDAVRYYTSQNLGEYYKKIARNNIGAISVNDLITDYNSLENRPCYIDCETKTILSTTTASNFAPASNHPLAYYSHFTTKKQTYVDGETYRVIYNNTEYDVICRVEGSFTFLGNASYYTLSYEDTGEPFLLQCHPNGANLFQIGSENATIAVHSLTKHVQQLSEELIPDTIARISDINQERKDICLTDKGNGYSYVIYMLNGNLISCCKTKSIKVTTMPTKTRYMHGEFFDPTDMVVMATCQDGTTREITEYTYASAYLSEGTTSIDIIYTEAGRTYADTIQITVVAFDAPTVLVDFTYTNNEDGTYTITGWKGTYNGKASTEIIIPNYGCIII